MVFLRCEAIRWVDDEPRPGLVEVRFTDAHQQQWAFVGKWPVFGGKDTTTPRTRSRSPLSLREANHSTEASSSKCELIN